MRQPFLAWSSRHSIFKPITYRWPDCSRIQQWGWSPPQLFSSRLDNLWGIPGGMDTGQSDGQTCTCGQTSHQSDSHYQIAYYVPQHHDLLAECLNHPCTKIIPADNETANFGKTSYTVIRRWHLFVSMIVLLQTTYKYSKYLDICNYIKNFLFFMEFHRIKETWIYTVKMSMTLWYQVRLINIVNFLAKTEKCI